MTKVQVIYDAFLARMTDDEWDGWTEEEVNQDLAQLLAAAIPWFKFPKVPLTLNEDGTSFTSDLSSQEIQILATYMKCEWLNRTILTWENVKPLYDERDFSQANLIDKFNQMLESEKENARRYESLYYRSDNFKPISYDGMAGCSH